jgi:hypothetical protein
MEQQAEQGSQRLQTESRFLERVSWVRKDKEALYRIIKVIKNSNNFLETILVCKPPKDPTILLPVSDGDDDDDDLGLLGRPPEELTWKSSDDQGFLLRLHDGLRCMNKVGIDGMWRLTIQLVRYPTCCTR